MELIYGAGLRISEALGLRIQDVDFGYKQITVWNGKGRKDRITMLPERVIPKLKLHIDKVRRLHQTDLKKGFGKTILPNALSKKYPGAESKFIWQYLFPSKTRRRIRARASNIGITSLQETSAGTEPGLQQARCSKTGHTSYLQALVCHASTSKRI